jgi:serine protease AprX
MAKITINGISVDPEKQGAALAGADLLSADSSASNYILIQTDQPLDRDQKNTLASLSVTLLEYVPENTYICHYVPSDLADIRSLPFVVWANIYLQEFKVPPSLQSIPSSSNEVNILDHSVATRSMSQATKEIEIILHDDASGSAVRDKIATAAKLDPTSLEVSDKKIRLVIQSRYLPDIAAIDEVRHIEEYVHRELHNNVALRILKADVTHSHASLEGSGQIVAVADTGFDTGSMADVHPAFGDRLLKLYPLGRSIANDPNGHGTHVAGSILGDGFSSILGGAIRGTAPKAKLIFQSVLDARGNLGGLPDNLNELFLPPYRDDGARIHSNSWGQPGSNGLYNANSREVDEFVWNHRDCVICFSAGNEGTDRNKDGVIDAGSVSAPGTAKNCITVGASENDRPTFKFSDGQTRYGEGWPRNFPAEPIASDAVATNPDGIVAFSSRGPTRDRRFKPDLVAPGSAILSTRSRNVTSPNAGWASSADPLYFFEGGTSMSNPLVAGCAAVTREYLQKQGIANPSAALIKAMLINGAIDIAGQYTPSESGAIPNYAEGFGRVDLARTVDFLTQDEEVLFWDEDISLDTGEEKTMTVSVEPSTPFLKVTLVWTDPPGETLQNDLDLIVRAANGQEQHGNMESASMEFDRRNNVEQINWLDVPSGDVTVVVRAFRAAIHPQSYALVVRKKKTQVGRVFTKTATPGLDVPDNTPAGVRNTLNFSESASIANIKVAVDITHTYIGDLVVTLTAPSDTAVILHNKIGGPADNIKQTFDLASTPLLASLAGQSIQGDWTLQIQDLADRDIGKLNRWELEIQGQ